MYKRILVAVDGSPTSKRGLDEAIRLAKSTGSRLLLVHVVNEMIFLDNGAAAFYFDKMVESLREAGTKTLEEAAAIVRRADIPFEQRLIDNFGGRPADEIVKAAKEWSADLIALGTHGRRGLKRLAMGSDAEIVVRESPVPVLLVRDGAAA